MFSHNNHWAFNCNGMETGPSGFSSSIRLGSGLHEIQSTQIPAPIVPMESGLGGVVCFPTSRWSPMAANTEVPVFSGAELLL